MQEFALAVFWRLVRTAYAAAGFLFDFQGLCRAMAADEEPGAGG